MKILVPLLTAVFQLVKMTAAILVFPLTCLCILGLLAFTIQIALQVRLERASKARRVSPSWRLGHAG